jgi:all-trans-retinol dehydrogenase (NAD+)
MSEITSRNILITGGASGIGRRTALALARLGGRLLIWDINQESLDNVLADLKTAGCRDPRGYLCDVSERRMVYEVAERVRSEVGRVDVVINNAGIVSGKPFLELPDEKIEATFRINTLALFWTAKAFLPDMIARDSGHVVTVASASGYVGVARLADYAASKWAAVAFDESLRVELKKNGSRIQTTVVCPYYVNTGMFRGVRSRFPRLLPILEEDQVAARIVRAIRRNQRRVVLPPFVNLLPMARVLPVRIFDALMTFLGVNSSMDEFVGRDSDRSITRLSGP